LPSPTLFFGVTPFPALGLFSTFDTDVDGPAPWNEKNIW
jgi:hypothetical protein